MPWPRACSSFSWKDLAVIIIHQKLKSHKQELVTLGLCSAPTRPKRWGLLNSWALPGASHPQLLGATWYLKPIMEGTSLMPCWDANVAGKGLAIGLHPPPCASGKTWGLGDEERPPCSGPVSLLSHGEVILIGLSCHGARLHTGSPASGTQ